MGPADYSMTVIFGSTPFGFFAYRHGVWMISGPEGYWLPVPSWAFAIGICTLAWLEWRLGSWALGWLGRKWQERRSGAVA